MQPDLSNAVSNTASNPVSRPDSDLISHPPDTHPIGKTTSQQAIQIAIAALETQATTPAEKVRRLLDMAKPYQESPTTLDRLENALFLYCRALELSEEAGLPLLQARSLVGLGAVLRSLPASDAQPLVEARLAYEKAMPLLQEHAGPPAIAAAEMNLGLVYQALVPFGLAQLSEAVQMYERALRVFTGEHYPREYAVLQNNLAIAYLSMPRTGYQDEAHQQRALSAFEQALRYASLGDYPTEYAMLQNNLGNTLQYLPDTHSLENNRRALAAYNEALRVRSARETPLEYAHTLANKAHVLFLLPDDDTHPEAGNRQNLTLAKALCEEAQAIFQEHQQIGQADAIALALTDIQNKLDT